MKALAIISALATYGCYWAAVNADTDTIDAWAAATIVGMLVTAGCLAREVSA